MNKQFGYTEITVSGQVIPLKISTYAIENLCKDFGVELFDLNNLFEVKDGKFEGKDVSFTVPKEPIRFLRSVLLHGANYVRWVDGKPFFTEQDVYEWTDEVGFSTAEAFRIVNLFMFASKNGAPAKVEIKKEEKKSKKKAPDVASAAG